MSPNNGRCMQRGPKRSALRTPVHAATGCGGFQRNAPIGGAAYGMPLNSSNPVAPAWMPESRPVSMRTIGGGSAAIADMAYRADANPAKMRNARAEALCMAQTFSWVFNAARARPESIGIAGAPPSGHGVSVGLSPRVLRRV